MASFGAGALVVVVFATTLVVSTTDRRTASSESHHRESERTLDDLFEYAVHDQAADALSANHKVVGRLREYYEGLANADDDQRMMPQRANAFCRLGFIYRRWKEFDHAALAFERAVALYERLDADAQQPSPYALSLAETRIQLGCAWVDAARWDKAAKRVDAAYGTLRAVQRQSSPAPKDDRILAQCYRCLTAIAAHNALEKQAVEWARSAVDVQRRIHSRDPHATEAVRKAMDAYHVLIHLLQWRDPLAAEVVCRSAIQFVREALSELPHDESLQLYEASAAAVLEELSSRAVGAVPYDMVSVPTAGDRQYLGGNRSGEGRRVVAPFVAPDQLYNAVIRRSVLKLSSGECVLLHFSPHNEGWAPEHIEIWHQWLEGDPSTDEDDARVYCSADDPLSTCSPFDFELSSKFNCHTFTVGPLLDLQQGDWLDGAPEPATNGTNPLQVVLDSYYRQVKEFKAGTHKMSDFETDTDLRDGDIACFADCGTEEGYCHSGRIQKVDGRNHILSKVGRYSITLASLRHMLAFYGQSNRLVVFRLKDQADGAQRNGD